MELPTLPSRDMPRTMASARESLLSLCSQLARESTSRTIITNVNFRVVMVFASTPMISPPSPNRVRPKIIAHICRASMAGANITCPVTTQVAAASSTRRSPYRYTRQPEKKGSTMLGAENAVYNADTR